MNRPPRPGAAAMASRQDLDWQRFAACKGEDPALFFDTDDETLRQRQAREARAKAVCWRCPVRLRCLDFAVREPLKWGVWGGKSEDERGRERARWLRNQRTRVAS